MTLTETVATVRRFAQAMKPDVVHVDEALEPLRALLEEAGQPYLLVGGIAVIHHGYVRATTDIDVLIQADANARLDPLLAKHGFVRERRTRLRHVASNVPIDTLIAGDDLARPGQGAFPDPQTFAPSELDRRVIGLGGLFELKLRADRNRDIGDVTELLKSLSDSAYIVVESQVDRALRRELSSLRDEALQELAWARAAEQNGEE